MPVLRSIRERFARERPLDGRERRAPACTSRRRRPNLVRTLIAGGAQVALCAANPLSTQDDVAAALVERDGAASTPAAARTPTPTPATSRAVLDTRAADHARRRRRPVSVLHAAGRAADGCPRRHRGDDHRPRAPARARRRRAPGCPGARRQRGAHRARCSTTTTAPASRRSTASCARPTCCSPAAPSSCSATARPAAASRCAPAAPARRSSSARSTRCARSRRGWRASR